MIEPKSYGGTNYAQASAHHAAPSFSEPRDAKEASRAKIEKQTAEYLKKHTIEIVPTLIRDVEKSTISPSRSSNAAKCTPIIATNLETGEVRDFEGFRYVEKFGLSRHLAHKAANGKIESYAGYKWEYKK